MMWSVRAFKLFKRSVFVKNVFSFMHMFSAKWESVRFRNCTCALWEFLLCPPIPELYRTILELRKGYFIDFCYNQALRKVGMGWTKWELGEYAWESRFNFDSLQRCDCNPTATTSNTLHFVCTVCMFCITGMIPYVTIWERERERERERWAVNNLLFK